MIASSSDARHLSLRPAEVDTSTWRTVADEDIPDPRQRKLYRKRCDAVDILRHGHGARAAAAVAGCSERNLRRLWLRCRTVAPDGEVWGYRALVPRTQINKRNRKAPLSSFENPSAGYVGCFGKLLRDYPSIRHGLIQALEKKGGQGRFRPNNMSGRQLHNEFKDLCQKAYITEENYPFNTKDQAKRTLLNWVRKDYLPKHASAYVAAEHGREAARNFDYQVDGPLGRQPPGCWEEWQLDEVKIDVQARYELLTPNFTIESVALPRIVAIVCKDVGSGAVPSWKLIIGREAQLIDILDVLWSAIDGPEKVTATVPKLDYLDGAGYPTVVLQQLRYALPRRVKLDNALTHLSNDLRNSLEMVAGCEVLLGTPKMPAERASIESELSVLARALLHQLPGTTGTGPLDPVRKTAAVSVEDRISVEALEHTIDVYFANRNGLPHAASDNVAPLARLKYALSQKHVEPVMLPSQKRHAHFFGIRREVTVRGNVSDGRRPFVVFLKVRYRGPALTAFAGLIGTKLVARAGLRDLRTIRVFDVKGAELGELRAEGKWGVLPHDARIRNLIHKQKRQSEFGERAEDDPLRKLLASLASCAPADSGRAAELAYLLNYLRPHVHDLSSGLVADMQVINRLEQAANDSTAVAMVAVPTGERSAKLSEADLVLQMELLAHLEAQVPAAKPQRTRYVLAQRNVKR